MTRERLYVLEKVKCKWAKHGICACNITVLMLIILLILAMLIIAANYYFLISNAFFSCIVYMGAEEFISPYAVIITNFVLVLIIMIINHFSVRIKRIAIIALSSLFMTVLFIALNALLINYNFIMTYEEYIEKEVYQKPFVIELDGKHGLHIERNCEIIIK